MDCIRIAEWNANGLIQHIQEIEMFLRDQKIDVCLISETHFTKETYIKIRGYLVYHTVHPSNKARGGTAVIVKNELKHHEETNYQTEAIQATSIKVQNKYKQYMITAVYCPPRYILKKEDFVKLFQTQGEYYIIGGDFNAKHWGSRIIINKGKELYKAGAECKCEFHSTRKPTYWPTDQNKIPDLIDFFVTKGVSNNYIQVEDCPDLASDHSSVILTVSNAVIKRQIPLTLTNRKTNWLGFRAELEKKITLKVPLKTPEQLEEVNKFNTDIQQAAWNNTPMIQRRNMGYNYPKEIRDMVNMKRRARKKWQHTRSPEDKTVLNRTGNELKRLIKEMKHATLNKFLSELTADKNTDYSLWKMTKGIKRPKMQIPPVRKEDGEWAKSNKEKADLFAEHLFKTFQPLPRLTNKETIPQIKKKDRRQIKFVTMKELTNEIKIT
ncbi:unnamed protein product [Lasius platythorax]|uniref:Endonuclease/exonuclease/phosphatase domain-containing protein n=1 Tax=Lasius platythorax TaxID=488582 RepID=A0AAV2MXR0_9HYME